MIDDHKWNHLLTGYINHLSSKRRYQILGMFLLIIVASLAEMISLGAVVPFVAFLVQPDKITSSNYIGKYLYLFNNNDSVSLITFSAVLFGVTAIIASLMRLLLLWAGMRLSNLISTDIGVEIFRRTLCQPYVVHLSRNSSEVISGIVQKAASVSQVITSVTTIASSTILFIAILITLFLIDVVAACSAVLIFSIAYYAVVKITKNKLLRNSRLISENQTLALKVLQEGLGGIRDVILENAQKIYIDAYHKHLWNIQKCTGDNLYYNISPRYIMESFGMVLISCLAIILNQNSGGVALYIPLLSALALGAQRLLPLLQQVYGNWAFIVGSKSSLAHVLNLLNQPLISNLGLNEHINFNNEISFKNLSFRYSQNSKLILDQISFSVLKGSRVGLVAPSGGGKSTLVDIVLGLLEPTHGHIIVDGVLVENLISESWRRNIAHVPQDIFLVDGTIEENIAFGIPAEHIDRIRVREVARLVNLEVAIEKMPLGYKTEVGERGVRLSGGERQRIGIARALYKNAKVLILDEATSALDLETEDSVMKSIYGLSDDLTIIIVAHRVSTLRNCTNIIKLISPRKIEILTYKQLISTN